MQSTAATVSAYLQEVPDDRRECLTALRNLCLKVLEGYEESMNYQMPSYKRNGVVEVAFASQKNYISLYILREDVVAAHRDLLVGARVGKGCIKYTKPDKINFAVVEQLLAQTRTSQGSVC